MFFLYVDESGNPSDSGQQHFILAGVTVFNRRAQWLAGELDELVAPYEALFGGPLELHGVPMWQGKSGWRRIAASARQETIKQALQLIAEGNCRIIASVVNKKTLPPGENPAHFTFRQVIRRFDHFLGRQPWQNNECQHGMLICDDSGIAHSLQALATEHKAAEHQSGKLHNMAEVPMFADSKTTRLLQLADLVAYALSRKYTQNDNRLFEIIKTKFDTPAATQHGLHAQL